MKQEKRCHLHASRSSGDSATGAAHPPTPSAIEQALTRFASHCEESALELAARLRVLARSIMAGSEGMGCFPGRDALFPVSYVSLRDQFENYLTFLAIEGQAEGNLHFPIVQEYLAGLLPVDIDHEDPKQLHQDLISRVEEVMALLTGESNGTRELSASGNGC